MSASDYLSNQLFHGTGGRYKKGDFIHPLSEETPLYSTTSIGEASSYGKHVYEIKPHMEGALDDDFYETESFTKNTNKGKLHIKNFATSQPFEVIRKVGKKEIDEHNYNYMSATFPERYPPK
jgi:hypothetical protein